jgi:hypothetical protein
LRGDRRNKVIALYDALRLGKRETERFRVAYGVTLLPALEGVTDTQYRRNGWIGDTCPYFDAIEAFDFLHPLTEAVPEAAP